jgi:hypothetical protein
MKDWNKIMTAAQQARFLCQSDRLAGWNRFKELLEEHPDEPMVLYERGWAFAELGDYDSAEVDMLNAAHRFPWPVWQQTARRAASTMRLKRQRSK